MPAMANRKNCLLDCVIVGGCGHVGLPLALSFADVGCRVGIHDIDTEKIAQVKSGTMPFLERGAEELLRKLLQTGRLEFSDQVDMVGRSDIVVTVIGTPIDEFMNPSMRLFERVVDQLAPHLRNGSLLVLRSTVYPGTTEYVETRLRDHGVTVEVAFCPERIAEGYALEENRTLPQVIGVHTDGPFRESRQRRAARLHHRHARSSPAAGGANGRHPGNGLQGRVGRPAKLAQLQTQEAGRFQGRPRALHRSLCARPRAGAAREGS